MKRKFTNMLLLAAAWMQFFVGCAYQKTYIYNTETTVEKPSGIYIGAMSFANDAKTITGSKPVFLNEEGGMFLVRALANRYEVGYAQNVTQSKAVEQSVSIINSQSEYFPSDLESVDIVIITDKKSSPPQLLHKALGKDVNVHYFNADREIEEIPGIAVKFTETFKKSSVVYLVLDAAPENEYNAIKIQYSAVAVIDALSEKIDINAPTPLVKVFVGEKSKSSTEIDWSGTSAYWIALVACGAIVALVVLLAMNSDSSSESY